MSTTIQATPLLLEGYCGPVLYLGIGTAYIAGSVVEPIGVLRHVRCADLSLDLTNRLAYLHTLAVVAERVGLDPSGGVMLRAHLRHGMSTVWSVHTATDRAWWFIQDASGSVDGRTFVPDLPTNPTAYPQAIAAIWRALEGV